MRPASPSPDAVPSLAAKGDAIQSRTSGDLGSRCLSSASSGSHGSATTAGSSTAFSRQSSGSYSGMSPSSSSNRLSTGSTGTAGTAGTTTGGPGASGAPEQRHPKRRGYMRPQGTDFAASARSRESVLSLGSIAHLQHYFARTGLLDLKGQLERRKRRTGKAKTLDLSQIEGTSTYTGPRVRSMMTLPTDAIAMDEYRSIDTPSDTPTLGDALVQSPVDDEHDDEQGHDDWYPEDFEGADPAVMLPPTVSTYMHREKPIPKPPSQAELKAELQTSLDNARASLAEAREAKASQNAPATPTASAPASPAKPGRLGMVMPNPNPQNAGARAAVTAWYEIQGMHLLDVMTLAIRAAKVYYTSHEHPDRLDAIKPEREVRRELLSVMDTLKRMATRNFAGGVRTEELRGLDAWVQSLCAMLDAEDAMVAAERAEHASWTWLKDDDWPADASPASGDPKRAYEREYAFLQSIVASASNTEDKVEAAIPAWEPMDRATGQPTAFLQHMQNGVCLIQLHNCAVRKSHRRFGAIPSWHADTQKPYRAADNLRYWVKAAELRWEVLLKIDALGIVCSSKPDVWPAFEDAIYQWCRQVRREISDVV